jgi:O-antigen ligase
VKEGFRLEWPNHPSLRQACTLPNACRLFALLLVAWQPFPGEYRVPLVGSALLGLVLSLRGALPAIAEPVKRLGLLLLCLVIPGLLSIPTSLAPGKSWGEIAAVALVALAGISVLYGLRTRTDHQWLQTGLVLVIAAWIGDGLLQAITGADLFGITPPPGFVTGPFRPNAIFGIILSVLLPLTFWAPLRERNKAGLGLLAGTLIVIVLTGQRNNLLLAALGLIALSTLWSKKTRLIFIAFFATALIAAYPLSPALQERGAQIIESTPEIATGIFNPSSTRGQNFDPLKELNLISSDRGYLFEAGLKMFRSQPWTGIGIGGFKKAYPSFTTETPPRTNIHAHNIYLEIMAEQGIVGLAGLATAILLCFQWYGKADRLKQNEAKPYAYTLLIMFFPLATHSSLYRAFYFSLVLLVTSGFLAALFSPANPHSAEGAIDQATTPS